MEEKHILQCSNDAGVAAYEPSSAEWADLEAFSREAERSEELTEQREARSNYFHMKRLVSDWYARAYSEGLRNKQLYVYFIVCKPYNDSYNVKTKLYQKGCFDYVRKFFGFHKDSYYFMTKETNAAKTHVNILYATTHKCNIMKYHDSNTNYYKYHIQSLSDLSPKSFEVRNRLIYIIKESKDRIFNKYADFIYSG